MNCLTINIRGMGEDAKARWVRRLKTAHKLNFVGVQETWIADYKKINVRRCWDSEAFEFEGVNSHGRSGGLICIWNNMLFQKTDVLKSRYYLIVVGSTNGRV